MHRNIFDNLFYLDKSVVTYSCDLFHRKWVENPTKQNMGSVMSAKFETFEHTSPLILLIMQRFDHIQKKMSVQNVLELTAGIKGQNQELLKLLDLFSVLSYNHLNLLLIDTNQGADNLAKIVNLYNSKIKLKIVTDKVTGTLIKSIHVCLRSKAIAARFLNPEFLTELNSMI